MSIRLAVDGDNFEPLKFWMGEWIAEKSRAVCEEKVLSIKD